MNLQQWCKNNGYRLKNKIDFNWDRYGDGLVSITTLLKLIEDPILDSLILKYPDKIKNSCDEGKKIHAEAEDFFNGKSTTINIEIFKQLTINNISILKTEVTYYKDGVRGTVDAIGTKDGKSIVVDYKNSKVASNKYLIQLGGYKYLTGYDGVLIFTKGIKPIFVSDCLYLNLFIELKEYFFYLLNKQNEISTHGDVVN